MEFSRSNNLTLNCYLHQKQIKMDWFSNEMFHRRKIAWSVLSVIQQNLSKMMNVFIWSGFPLSVPLSHTLPHSLIRNRMRFFTEIYGNSIAIANGNKITGNCLWWLELTLYLAFVAEFCLLEMNEKSLISFMLFAPHTHNRRKANVSYRI